MPSQARKIVVGVDTERGRFEEVREPGFLSERDEHRVDAGLSYSMIIRAGGERWEERKGKPPLRVLLPGGCRDIRFDELETRSAPLEIRQEEDGGRIVLRGTAAVFNQRSVDLGGFVEVIEPGFFRDVLAGDTVANWQHDDSFVLGRTTATPPTLELSESARALEVEIFPADHPTNQDRVFSPIERGEVRHMSFAFRVLPDGDQWEELPDGRLLRTLLAGGCASLLDVTPATRPAYEGTEVGLRSLDRWRESHPDFRAPATAEATGPSLRLRALRQRARLLRKDLET